MRTGIRSSEAPALVAMARPAVAMSESESSEAMSVPTIAQAASVSSAPNLRNHRNPYTAETALPPGRELAMVWEAKVIWMSVHSGGFNPPLVSTARCSPAKQKKDAISATTAGHTHHQFSRSKAPVMPDSSLVWELRAHRVAARIATATSTLIAGQNRRSRMATGRAPDRVDEAFVMRFPTDATRRPMTDSGSPPDDQGPSRRGSNRPG